MEITFQQAAFFVVALLMIAGALATVMAKRILRAVTALLVVLFCTAAFYFMLGYTFLGTVQITVYAGGIVVLYVFSILLTRSEVSVRNCLKKGKATAVLATTLTGAALTLWLLFNAGFTRQGISEGYELSPLEIGDALVGPEKYQFVLPFEVISVLLLACIIGAVMIARKR